MFRITVDPLSGSLVQRLAKNFKNDSIVSVDTIESFFKFLAKRCTRLPDDGSSVIRNML